MVDRHQPTLEPVKADNDEILWTGSCDCGRWTAVGHSQTSVMVAHYGHVFRIKHPISPLVHDILQAKQGKGVPPHGA